jgi:hypothetical protein
VEIEQISVNVQSLNVKIEESYYSPIITPTTNYSEITKEEIKKEAEKLANQMLKSRKIIECICPDCGTEFEIDA